jgi:hypothetical protein
MKIYFAHAMPTYGTRTERTQKAYIKKLFPKHKLIDPGSIQDNPQKRREGMAYCLKLVGTCDALVFSRYCDEITAGVGKEVNHALGNDLEVYELINGKAKKVKARVNYLSISDTVRLPRPNDYIK